MLTLPDFREKKILCIQAEKDITNQLKFWNSNIRLYKQGSFVNQISCHLVLCVFIIGPVTLTSVLIEKAKKHGISLFLLNYSLHPYAQIDAAAEGNYALRTNQYTASTEQELQHAKCLIHNKISNQIAYMKTQDKDQANKIANLVFSHIEQTTNRDTLRGIEGSVSSRYFPLVFGDIGWNRRAPQTREDIPNLLLDIGYTFLFNYVDALLRLFGFDTYKGFYHQLYFQRRSLSCDLMEPIRPLIDKTLVKAYNLKQIAKKDFVFKNGSFQMRAGQDLRRKYTKIFFDVLTHHKEPIYEYLRAYYLHCMNPQKYQFPLFAV